MTIRTKAVAVLISLPLVLGLFMTAANAASTYEARWLSAESGPSPNSVRDISDAGLIVGSLNDIAWSWVDGVGTALGPSGLQSYALAVASDGSVFGSRERPDGMLGAVLFRDGQIIELPGPIIWGVSADGHFGVSSIGVNSFGIVDVQTGVMSNPVTFADTSYVYARDINSAGVVVGRYRDFGSRALHPFLYDSRTGVRTNLAFVGGATAINDHGLVAGWTTVGDSVRAWVGTADRQVVLDVLPGDDIYVQGINNHGELVGYRLDGTSFIATPITAVPEPATLILVIGGLAGLIGQRRLAGGLRD